jgi:hypothetical protein
MTRSAQGVQTTFIAAGSTSVSTDTNGRIKMNVDLQLARLGGSVVAFSCDQTAGSNCVQIGSIAFPEGPALAGLAVTSHDPSILNQASFDGSIVASVPFPWGSSDVGNVGTIGFATYEDATGTFFISGAGSDIWGTSDAFHTVTQSLSGDSQLTTRVVSEDGMNGFAKAGLTMGDPSPDGARVILDLKPDGGVEFMARSSAGTPMAFISGSSAPCDGFPCTFWLRLTRTSNDFAGEVSQDGQTWTSVGSVTVAFPTAVQGGFAVTSHDTAALNAAVFDNVGVTTGLGLGPVGPNLVVNPGFEDSIPPNTPPAWVSDTPLRQTPAVSETTLPHTGQKNGA